MIEIGEQSLFPPCGIDPFANMTVEVAIRAFGMAERPVDIDRERLDGTHLSGSGGSRRRAWRRRERGG
jgi:hypothetical protein